MAQRETISETRLVKPLAGASESTRGIRTLPDEGTLLTAGETTWVQAEAAVGRFVHDETPSGAVNGSNPTFTTANAPVAGTLIVYEGGARKLLTTDFTLSGSTITFTYNPPDGSYVRVDYRY